MCSDTFMSQLEAQAASCGYSNYFDDFVTYPPKGQLPYPGNTTKTQRGCDIWDTIYHAALTINPAFDIYRVFDTVRANGSIQLNRYSYLLLLFDSTPSCGTSSVSRKSRVWSQSNSTIYSSPHNSGSFPQTQLSPLYFDRDDVKKAIHAPANVNWIECANGPVFLLRDQSLPPALTVLPSVIEKSERAVIVHGLADFILIAEG